MSTFDPLRTVAEFVSHANVAMLMLPPTLSRTRYLMAFLAMLGGVFLLARLLFAMTFSFDAPLWFAYPAGKLLALWIAMSLPLIWLCRARMRDAGGKPLLVVVVWGICSMLLVAYLGGLWMLGQSWGEVSDFEVALVSLPCVIAVGLGVWSLLWLALKKPAGRGSALDT